MPQKYKVFFNHNKLFIAKKQLSNIEFKTIYLNPSKLKIQDIVVMLIRDDNAANYLIVTDDLEKTWLEFCSYFEIRKAAGGLVINKKNERLFIKRNGFWDLPKGHLEKDEKNRDAAIREVQEECGIQNLIIKQKLIKTYHTYMLKKVMVLKPTKWYLMTYSNNKIPKPQINEGITEVGWFNKKKEIKIINDCYPSIIEVLNKANAIEFSSVTESS